MNLDGTARPFGRYVLLERLAKGGMGEVYLAVSPGPHGVAKPCVLKLLLPEVAGDGESVERFIEEARVLVSLAHRNVVQILEFGRAKGEYFIAMEYVEGVSLGGLLADGGRLPVELALFITREVLSGLAYAHSRTDPAGRPHEIVHRDVSPSNVLVSFAGDVKLADFGLARRKARTRLTAMGVVVGKLAYMAPELLRRQTASPQSDLYALGVCLYEMLSGRPLFDLKQLGQQEAIQMLRAPSIIAPSRIRPEVRPAIDAICLKALAREPEGRYLSAEAMRKDVQVALAEVAPATDNEALARLVQSRLGPQSRRQYQNPFAKANSSDEVESPEETVSYVAAQDFFARRMAPDLLARRARDDTGQTSIPTPISDSISDDGMTGLRLFEITVVPSRPRAAAPDSQNESNQSSPRAVEPARPADEAETSVYSGGPRHFSLPSGPIDVGAFARPVSESVPLDLEPRRKSPPASRGGASGVVLDDGFEDGPDAITPPPAPLVSGPRTYTPLAPIPAISVPLRRSQEVPVFVPPADPPVRRGFSRRMMLTYASAFLALFISGVLVAPAILGWQKSRVPKVQAGQPARVVEVTGGSASIATPTAPSATALPVSPGPDRLGAARRAAERAMVERHLSIEDSPDFQRLYGEGLRLSGEGKAAAAQELFSQLGTKVVALSIDEGLVRRKLGRVNVLLGELRAGLPNDQRRNFRSRLDDAEKAASRASYEQANRHLEKLRREIEALR